MWELAEMESNISSIAPLDASKPIPYLGSMEDQKNCFQMECENVLWTIGVEFPSQVSCFISPHGSPSLYTYTYIRKF